ncbi:MAG: TolC family protein [Desulfonatronovibrio sp.]
MKVSSSIFWNLLVLLMLIPVHKAAAQEVLDIEDAVNMGLKQNHSLQAVREALKGSEYAVKSARGAFGPKFKTSYAYTRLDEAPSSMDPVTRRRIQGSRDVWTMNFNIEQPLFTGFNILSNFEKARLGSEQADSQVSKAELDLILEIQTSFLDLLAARESVSVAEDSLTRLKSHLNVSQSFYDVGLAPKLDVLQAQVDVAQARQDLISAKNAVDNLTARLNMLLNLPLEHEVFYQDEFDFPAFTLTLEDCRERALKKRPDIFIADKSVQIALKDEKISASSFYPQIGASFDYYRRGDDPSVSGSKLQDKSEWQAGVKLEWKLFEWGQTYYAHKQAGQKTRQLMAEYENLLNTVLYEVKSNFLNIDESRQRIDVAREGLEEAKESYRMAVARYEAQVGTNTDVLDAQARLSGAEANLIHANADYLKALAAIYKAMGEKNISLGTR